MAEKKLIGEVSQEQIDKWKADPKNKTVTGIIAKGHIAYVRKPDHSVVSYALSHMSFSMSQSANALEAGKIEMSMGKMLKQGDAVLQNCWLGGSDEIKTDVDLWASACMKASELVQFEEAELKNF